MLRHREGNPVTGRRGQFSLLKFRPHPRIGPQYGRGSGQDTNQLVDLPAADLDALENRRALLGSSQLVVDMESTYFCFHGHDVTFPIVSRSDGRPVFIRRLASHYFTFS